MKKSSRLVWFLLMVMLVFTLSGGCDSDDDDNNQVKADKIMVISSPVLYKGESYKLYRGDKVSVLPVSDDYNPTYYVAPIAGSETVVMNLEFADSISGDDKPFMITAYDGDTEITVFYYNPDGDGTTDTTTDFGRVVRLGGSSQQLSYEGLNVSGASVRASVINGIDTSSEQVIELNADDNTATIDGSAVASYNYVWHADPDHRDEYFTLGDSSEELTEDEMNANISEGVYIARDIRYTPDTLNFTGTATKDEDTEYVAYYSDSVAAEVAAELGDGFEGPYIFATLPMSMGQPGGNGGPDGHDGNGGPGSNPPDRNPVETPVANAAVSNSDIAAFSTMTHSAEDAYNNPVLHITEPGTYRLKGTWHGQIWLDPGDDAEVVVILDGVTVSCDVAPAIVFHDVHECGPDDEDTVDAEWKTLGAEVAEDAGAVVVIADGSVNSFTGANVYRLLKAQPKKDSVTKIDGTDISQQKKRYKMDGAFYSFVSMVIGAASNNNAGTLDITSTTYEGLGSELHLTIDSGKINVTAEDDGINVNEDDLSVFTMNGGSLTVIAKGGDGIDSNGYIAINAGTLDISAAQDSNQTNAQAEGPIDADKEVYIDESVTYSHRQYTATDSDNSAPNTDNNSNSGSDNNTKVNSLKPIEIKNEDKEIVMSIRYTDPSKDVENTSRNVRDADNVFTLNHTVNSFAGVKVRNNAN